MTDWTDLLSRCRNNETLAQRELYDLFKSRLMGLCRRYTATREEAQDVLQEVFVKIFTKMNTLESDRKFEGWMMRIAVTTAINYYHRNRRIQYSEINEDIENENYELIVSGISDKFLVGLINELPDGCRLVFNLSVVEGYSHVEIADLLKISESTSRSQLHHARALLQEKLKSAGVNRYEKYA